MKLSFVIPTYNCEAYIEDCLKSIWKANLHLVDYEIIIVDDASTDNTYKVCEKYVLMYQNLQLVRQIKSGPASARNKGLSLAKGEYVWFVDSDDIICSDNIKTIIKYLDSKNELIAFNYQVVSPTRVQKRKVFAKDLYCNGLFYIEQNYHGLYLWDKIFKKSIIKEKFIPNIYHIEDLCFDILNILPLQKVVCLDVFGYMYKMQNTLSISKSRDLNSVLKANSDAFIVYSHLLSLYKKTKNKRERNILHLVLAHGIVGHFFTMMKESPWKELKKYRIAYKRIGLYPIWKTDEFKKNIFLFLVNSLVGGYFVFLFCKLKNI